LISKGLHLAGWLIVSIVLAATRAQAATVSVDPIILELKAGKSSETVAVTNPSAQALRLQVTGFTWHQNPAGEMQLTPTDKLVFFPQLLTLAAGETRRIRVGSTVPLRPVEQTFRMYLEELPSLPNISPSGGAFLTLRMRIGVPVFVSAAGPRVVTGAVKRASVRRSALAFDVANTGNTRFSVQKIHVVGKNAVGGDIFSENLPGWYVLAGTVRHYNVRISKQRCEAMRSLSIGVRADPLKFSSKVASRAKDCV
jgi:fimbrial chaperone protein